jgi:hypothetical protein
VFTYLRQPLDDCFARVDRAGEHLAEFERALGKIREQQAYSIPLNFNPAPPHEWVRAPPTQTFYGAPLGIIVGEICYNLRTALDYLVFQLAKLDSGIEQKGTQFPIMDSHQVFAGNEGKSRLKGVSAAHIAMIERLQPYNGVGWTKALRETSNPDKHRELVAHNGTNRIHVWPPWHPGFDALVGCYSREATHPVRGVVEMKVHVAIEVAFDDGSLVREMMQEIKTGVAKTLTDFKPEF